MPYEIPNRWPLVTSLQNREADFFYDGRILNGYAEFNPQTKQYSVERRPGVFTPAFTTVPSASAGGGGLFTFDNALIQKVGTQLYRNGIFLGTVGTAPAAQGYYTFQPSSSDADVLMLGYGQGAYSLSGFNLTQITDPNYPANTVPGIGYINGTFYVMDQFARIFGSRNEDDPLSWDPLNVIVAQQKAGFSVYLASQLSYLIALKNNSAEVFWDSGQTQAGSGSTLQPIPGAMIPYGCFDGLSVQEIDGTLLWLTTNESASPQVGRLDNLQFQIVSTPAVDRLLRGIIPGAAFSMILKIGGHRFYVLHTNSVAWTLVYDLDQNLWYSWTDTGGQFEWPYYYSAAVSSGSNADVLVQGLDGQAHILQEDYVNSTDKGQIFPVDIYTPNFDGDIDREKFLPALYFNSDIVKGSIITVRYSDDDYKTWTNPLTVNLGQKKPMLTDLGSFYRRAFHIRHNVATPFRIRSVGMTIGLGTL